MKTILLITLFLIQTAIAQTRTYTIEGEKFTLETLCDASDVVWGLDFFSDSAGEILFSERSGKLQICDAKNKSIRNVAGAPAVFAEGQGGLLDVLIHPRNKNIYITFSESVEGGKNTTSLFRAELTKDKTKLQNGSVIFRSTAVETTDMHFSSLVSSTATAAYADAFYGGQDICGIDVTGQTCDVIDFSSGDPLLKGGLNDNQCMFLCVIKSIDALNHMQHPSFSICPFEYKTDLSGDLTTRLPIAGTCTAANGNPCPGLIDKPERVLSRSFYEEAKVVGDTASFYISRTDNVRHCAVDVQPPNFPDGDFSDLGECYTFGYDEKISVVVRQLSSTQAYASQRISRIPLATNSPTKCGIGGSDNSFIHRAGLVGLMNINDFTLTGNSLSHVYLMTK